MPYKLDNVRILVVDDMQPMLDLCKAILSLFGFQHIYTADNAEKAFEYVCNKEPDLIITDWIMEPDDGLKLTKRIRTDSKSPDPFVPIIMMTGFSSRLRVEEARDAGVTEFLVKPFTSEDLYKRIHQIIEKPRKFVDADAFFGPDRRRRMNVNYKGPKRRENDEEQPEYSDEFKNILKTLKSEVKNI
jgi:CheY-like chemotaxis protein